jgi:hypothetical protein
MSDRPNDPKDLKDLGDLLVDDLLIDLIDLFDHAIVLETPALETAPWH